MITNTLPQCLGKGFITGPFYYATKSVRRVDEASEKKSSSSNLDEQSVSEYTIHEDGTRVLYPPFGRIIPDVEREAHLESLLNPQLAMRMEHWIGPGNLATIGVSYECDNFDASKFECWLHAKKYKDLDIHLGCLTGLVNQKIKWAKRRLLQFPTESLPNAMFNEREEKWEAHLNKHVQEVQEDTWALLCSVLEDAHLYLKDRWYGVKMERHYREATLLPSRPFA